MKPMDSGRPRFSTEEAQALALEMWSHRGIGQELPSERDQNFLIRTEDGAEYVLKITSASEKKEVLELQVQAIRHLARHVPKYAWPQAMKTDAGEEIATTEHKSGTRHLVRLLPYLPGRFLSRVKPHSPELLRSLGVFLGSMDKAFSTFDHPAADRELKWNMKLAAATIRSRLKHIVAPGGRALVELFLERFKKQTRPLLGRLRTGLIHNDANDNNVLVGRPAPDSGLLDSKVI